MKTKSTGSRSQIISLKAQVFIYTRQSHFRSYILWTSHYIGINKCTVAEDSTHKFPTIWNKNTYFCGSLKVIQDSIGDLPFTLASTPQKMRSDSSTMYVFYFQNWLTFSKLHKPLFTEYGSVKFPNTNPPKDEDNNAYCKVRWRHKVPAIMSDHMTWNGVICFHYLSLLFRHEVRKHLFGPKPPKCYQKRIKERQTLFVKSW